MWLNFEGNLCRTARWLPLLVKRLPLPEDPDALRFKGASNCFRVTLDPYVCLDASQETSMCIETLD